MTFGSLFLDSAVPKEDQKQTLKEKIVSEPDYLFFRSKALPGGVKFCEKVNPLQEISGPENCTVICSPNFLNHVTNQEKEEFALCNENTTIGFSCNNHNDCRRYHMGASCKRIPCLCEIGNRILYMWDSKAQINIPNLSVCTVPMKWLNPEMALVPFPWKTLLVVFGIVASFAICLIVVRWLSPFIRAMQAKNAARSSQNRRTPADGDGEAPLFSIVPLPEQTHIRPYGRNRRRFEPSTSTNSVMNSDKPPPYEVAIQGPPTYDEVEQEPLNPDEHSVEVDVERNFSRLPQRPLTHTASNTSITTI